MSGGRPRSRMLGVLTVLVVLVPLLVGRSGATAPVKGPHGSLEIRLLRDRVQGFEVRLDPYFVPVGRSARCPGHDPLGIAALAGNGVGVNVVDDRRLDRELPGAPAFPWPHRDQRHGVRSAPPHRTPPMDH